MSEPRTFRDDAGKQWTVETIAGFALGKSDSPSLVAVNFKGPHGEVKVGTIGDAPHKLSDEDLRGALNEAS